MIKVGGRYVPVVIIKTQNADRVSALADKIVNCNSDRAKNFRPYSDDEIDILEPMSDITEFIVAKGLGPAKQSTFQVAEGNNLVNRDTVCYDSGIAVSSSLCAAVKLEVYKRGIVDKRNLAARFAEANAAIKAVNDAGVDVVFPIAAWDLDEGVALCSGDVVASGLQINALSQSTVDKLKAVCGVVLNQGIPAHLSHCISHAEVSKTWSIGPVEAQRIVTAGRKLIGMPVHLMMALNRSNEISDYLSLYARMAAVSEKFASESQQGSTYTISVADLFMDASRSLSEVLGRHVEDPEFALELVRGNVDLRQTAGPDNATSWVVSGDCNLTVNGDELIANRGNVSARFVIEDDFGYKRPNDLLQSIRDVREYLSIVYALYCGFTERSPYMRVSPQVLQWLNVNLGNGGGLVFP